jgi:transcriptional regulator with XRE-family HTH domain
MKKTAYSEKIRLLRKARAWSQEQLASVASISSRTLQRIEKGESASPETLMALASALEIDVSELTREIEDMDTPEKENKPQQDREADQKKKEPSIIFLTKVSTGQELCDLVIGVHGCNFANDELQSEQEINLVGGFLQEVEDWGDIWNDVDHQYRLRTIFHFTESIQELEAQGLWVFAGRSTRKVRLRNQRLEKDEVLNWTFGFVYVLRSNNPKIVKPVPSGGYEFIPIMLPKKYQFI